MIVNDLLLQLRLRLRDEDFDNFRFSNSFLIETLSLWQNKLLLSFDLNIISQKQNLSEKIDFLKLKFEPLKIIVAKFNNINIKLLPLSTALKRKDNIRVLTQIKHNIYKIMPFSQGLLELFYIPKQSLINEESELIIDDSFKNALIYGVLSDVLQIETSNNNLNKASLYTKLYEKECDFCRGLTANLRNGESLITTPYTKI
ncbi:hypothetical protein FMM55_00700 [Campylobacter sp. LR196d]|uniref:hypothetical protein n=1 Tax=Campylobacter sp. LR196d TaxID=2593543 RepID=UPI00123C4986|nr:hypothetical protein [Campylobacter sp. LR196d]KAA6228840.1 hypothetical protein FMM55_00700 [Campylobacter sp. LR196d]